MNYDISIQDNHHGTTIIIPEHELEITASRSSGAGGQHVNKTSTRITVRWNIKNSTALTDEQKMRIMTKLRSKLTAEGDLIIHNSESRSQEHNKKLALLRLAQEIRKALYVPKQRTKTKTPRAAHEARLQKKARRGLIKKQRREKFE